MSSLFGFRCRDWTAEKKSNTALDYFVWAALALKCARGTKCRFSKTPCVHRPILFFPVRTINRPPANHPRHTINWTDSSFLVRKNTSFSHRCFMSFSRAQFLVECCMQKLWLTKSVSISYNTRITVWCVCAIIRRSSIRMREQFGGQTAWNTIFPENVCAFVTTLSKCISVMFTDIYSQRKVDLLTKVPKKRVLPFFKKFSWQYVYEKHTIKLDNKTGLLMRLGSFFVGVWTTGVFEIQIWHFGTESLMIYYLSLQLTVLPSN